MRILKVKPDKSGINSLDVEWSDGTRGAVTFAPWIGADDIKRYLSDLDSKRIEAAAHEATRKAGFESLVTK